MSLDSDRGGLPEAVGPGGGVIPHDAPAGRAGLDSDLQVSRLIATPHSAMGTPTV
jgi:hypothetical protein